MRAVTEIEQSNGCRVEDVSKEKCVWDITSHPPSENRRQPDARHIEVKCRTSGADTVTMTRNEMLYALNQTDRFVLAIVQVGESDAVESVHYLKNLFETEPPWGTASINFHLGDLLTRGERIR